MGFKVLITDHAVIDLREIVEFVALDDPRAAVKLGEKLIGKALSLSSLPERFPVHDGDRKIRMMPVSPYLVFYTCDVGSSLVHILHFWHGARDWPEFD
jgi:plasmid stabilization system protein ParE